MPVHSQTVVERGAKGARRLLADLVMAWAQDAETGEPRYILELGADRRGAKSGCVCVGCGEPLTAVNAAKTQFILRPHFRHPDGVEHGDCLVLAARAAAVRQFHEAGWVDLPRRRMSANVAGLSGEFYDAWVERPPEKLQISQVDYRDRAAAVFTFADGRQLRVDLTGSPARTDSVAASALGATVLIAVDDPEIAAMDPAEVRKRLTLLPEPLCWRAHWADAEMLAEARRKAHGDAVLYLDEVPDGLVLPGDMDPALKRETVLHYEAKRILMEQGRVAVPGYELDLAVANNPVPLTASWSLEPDVLALELIELEQPFDDIVPDISCKAWPVDGGRVFWPTFIEVTVTNAIDEARCARIRSKGHLALEIDLSLAGGRVTRDELRRLVVDELATKRWIYHPKIEEQRRALLLQLEAHAQRRAAILATPITEIGREYLDCVMASLRECKRLEECGESAGAISESALDEALAAAIHKLVIHGYPEAGDGDLIYPHSILDRILSIQHDEGVGYRLKTGQAVLNAILQDRGAERSFHSLYFIAALAFKPRLTETQRQWFDTWRAHVRDSIRAGETTFRRDPVYDRLLAVLFPPLAEALARSGGKRRPPGQPQHRATSSAVAERQEAMFLQNQPRADTAAWGLQDTEPGDWWLKGRDLERWRRQNPQWARIWSPETPKT